ncbi:uncharacterized protein LOC110859912 [Folsomia candida]|nr:uncharacterized protein LOC110859912 [Folsomia candida]
MGCCGVTGLRISTVLALVISLCLALYSGYLFHSHYLDKYSDTTRALDSITGIFNKSVTTKLNIKLFCTGAVAVGAGLQFLGSLAVVICAGPNSSKLLLTANTTILILLISVIACYFTAKVDYENDQQVQFFLGGCVLDLVILVYASCVAGAFLRN